MRPRLLTLAVKSSMKTRLGILRSPEVIRIAVKTSLVVGTLLNAINHGPTLLRDAGAVHGFALLLNYVIPYCVSSWSASSMRLAAQRGA